MDKKQYEDSAIAQYYHAIENNEIVVSKDIKSLYRHLYAKLYDDKIDGYHFDEKKAKHPIEFIERFCRLVKVRGNPPCTLDTWQKALIESIFGFVDKDGNRQYKEALILLGRKNGKSYLASCIALYMLIADGESEPEVYTVANTKDQSKVIWSMAIQIYRKSPELRQYLKDTISEIKCTINGGIIKPLAAQDNNLDGLSSSLILMDESHEQKTENLYNVMVDSTAARQQPLTLITTTNGFVRDGFLDAKINEYEQIIRGYQDGQYIDNRRIGFLYRLDKKSEWRDPKKWIKANPGLGSIRSLSALAEDVERAKKDETKIKNLLTKFMNLSETGESHFLDYDDLKDDKTFDIQALKPRYYIGGFDLSQVNDLTSAAALFRVPNDNNIYVLSMSWMPEDALEAHLKSDKVPYDIWHEKGYLRLCRGNRINYHDIASWFEELKNDYDIYPYKIGYDRYSASYLVEDLTNLYGADCLAPVAQGAKTLSLPLQHLKTDFRKRIINYNNNPLFRWCCLNLQVTQDNNGNYNTCKNRNANIRDDAVMALLDAYVVYINELENYCNLI